MFLVFLSACVLAFLTMAVHATGIAVLRSHYYKKTVGFLWCVQETLEKEFVQSLPYARFRAFEYTVDHLRGTVRIESATSVEPSVADDLGTLAYRSGDVDAGRVVIHAFCIAPRVIPVLAKAPTPHATKICHRNQHSAMHLSAAGSPDALRTVAPASC